MTQVRKKISFEQQAVYISIDVHKKHWTIAICTEHREYRPFNISPPSVDVLANRLQSDFPNANFICAYEAGFSGFGFCEELIERGIQSLSVTSSNTKRGSSLNKTLAYEILYADRTEEYYMCAAATASWQIDFYA